MENKLSVISKVALIVAAVLLWITPFVPIWIIYLDAPQYPEGLSMQIHANKLAGDVEIINGLNHYIGMKTLHSDEFVEFKVLPYILGAFGLLFALSAFLNSKKMLYISLISFVLFGILAMVDFYMWEYNYGHNLDPNAAIKVPGMTYQPPLIGFKQLLNFGAFSVPHIGGWLLVVAGIFILGASVFEWKFRPKKIQVAFIAFLMSTAGFLSSCTSAGPKPIELNKDMCAFCRMSISDGRFGAEIITKKNRIYTFDDLSCMDKFAAGEENVRDFYIHDFSSENTLIEATSAYYVQHESVRSPMGGNFAAFKDKAAAEKLAGETGTKVLNWEETKHQKTAAHSH